MDTNPIYRIHENIQLEFMELVDVQSIKIIGSLR